MAHAVHSAETHPCVLYTASDTTAIRARLDTQPYQDWFAAEQAYADGILAQDVDWTGYTVIVQTKAFYAKVLAFVWAFSDISHEHRDQWEEAALRSLYYMPQNTYNPPFTSDLAVSEAAVFWAEAYDILKGGGSDFMVDGLGDTEPAIRIKLKSLRDYLARDDYELFPSSPRIGNDFLSAAWVGAENTDNHHVKLHAALATISCVIIDESGSQDDLNHALSRLSGSLGNLAVASGGWAEGPDYLLYSAHEYLVAINTLKNCGVVDIYATLPELVATHLMLPRMVMPDGYLPPWDDSGAVVFDLAGLLWSHHADQPGRDMLHWMWIEAGSPVPIAFRADYIAGFDNTPPVYTSPDEMDVPLFGFNPESGFVRFRDNWDDDAVYLLLQAEHGDLHSSGRAHEHPDQNAFLLHAFGELLLMDTGYGGWSYHDETRYAEDHNLVLIDGAGPPEATQPLPGLGTWSIEGEGAHIRDGFSSSLLDYAYSETTYESTIMNRHVTFHDHRYFVIYDTVESWSDATLTVLLHGNGGETSGGTFTQTALGGTWHYGGAAVDAAVTGSTGSISLSTQIAQHAVYGRTLKTHSVLKASQQASAASFVTVLFPYRTGETAPVVTEVDTEYGSALQLEGAGIHAYAGLRAGGGDVAIKNGETTVVSSDGAFVWCETSDGLIPQSLFIIYGRRAADSSGTIIDASQRLTLTLDRTSDESITGYAQPDDMTELTFYGIEAETVIFNDSPLPYAVVDGNTVFTVTSAGEFVIGLPVPEVVLTAPNGFEEWNARDTYEITWSSEHVDLVNLAYTLDNGSNWTTFAENVDAETGVYQWDLPDTVSSHCLVRITSAGDGTVADQSDAPFSLYLPSITVIIPNGSEEWRAGANESITWSSDHVAAVNLEYSLDNGVSWNNVAESIPAADGAHMISVPDTVLNGCIVRISDSSDSTVRDQSDEPFSIYRPTLSVTVPNGGEIWQPEEAHTITWYSSYITEINIEYSTDNGETWSDIVTMVDAAMGSFEWIVPDSPSEMCLLRLTEASDGAVFDQSDTLFTIETASDPRSITVITPNGGEEWKAGSQQEIWWETTYEGVFTLDYSLNTGDDWKNIGNTQDIVVKNTALHDLMMWHWKVPDTASENCLIRIQDITDEMISDVSDSTFTILPDDMSVQDTEPRPYLLVSCYPNPFNPRTTISCELSQPADLSIYIYNVLGQQVRAYTPGRLGVGEHTVVFDASNLTSGLYFYRVDAGDDHVSGKMLYMR